MIPFARPWRSEPSHSLLEASSGSTSVFAIALAVTLAFGGIGWYKYRGEQLEFSRYRESQARLVTIQQEAIIEERERVDEISRSAVNLYHAGQKATEERNAPHIAALESLNRAYRERLRDYQGTGSGALSGAATAAGGADATACHDQLQRVTAAAAGVTAAAERVARDLAGAELALSRLVQLQGWAGEVGEVKPGNRGVDP